MTNKVVNHLLDCKIIVSVINVETTQSKQLEL